MVLGRALGRPDGRGRLPVPSLSGQGNQDHKVSQLQGCLRNRSGNYRRTAVQKQQRQGAEVVLTRQKSWLFGCLWQVMRPACRRCGCVLQRCCRVCVRALCACCVRCACIGPMLIRHETCAGVWACAGQRHFVPRTYPGPLNPLSPPSSGPNNLGTSRVGRCWGGEKRPTHCVADRHNRRRCISVSPNRRAAPRGPLTILTGMSPCDTPPTS
jgi:hypothetical protein